MWHCPARTPNPLPQSHLSGPRISPTQPLPRVTCHAPAQPAATQGHGRAGARALPNSAPCPYACPFSEMLLGMLYWAQSDYPGG